MLVIQGVPLDLLKRPGILFFIAVLLLAVAIGGYWVSGAEFEDPPATTIVEDSFNSGEPVHIIEATTTMPSEEGD